jgi:hypothetical protein
VSWISAAPGRYWRRCWLILKDVAGVLYNLVQNAIRYTPSDWAISISVQDLGPMVQIGVVDTGQSIPTVARVWGWPSPKALLKPTASASGSREPVVRELLQFMPT